jgi:uncharacterized protein (UPF0333 family)
LFLLFHIFFYLIFFVNSIISYIRLVHILLVFVLIFLVGKMCLNNNNKGQVSMEFIITIILIMGIFIFSLFLFENRFVINQSYSEQWDAMSIANRFSRNINNVYLMDENALVIDYFFWNDPGKRIVFEERTIFVFYNDNDFIDATITSIFDYDISDLNGAIFFRRNNNGVMISYE